MGVFGDLNKVEIIGNITQDIELRYTTNGSAVTNFSVATNRNFKQGEEWKKVTEFHNVVVWANDAEMLAQRAKKGTRLFVSGRLQTRSWEDQEGKKNYKTEIISESIILLDRYEKLDSDHSGESAFNSQGSAPKATKPVAKSAPSKEEASGDSDIIDPDDLPF